MKRLSSFMVMNVDGGDKISYTYNEINGETGESISENNKRSFYVLDETLKSHINAIRDYIRENKLEE